MNIRLLLPNGRTALSLLAQRGRFRAGWHQTRGRLGGQMTSQFSPIPVSACVDGKVLGGLHHVDQKSKPTVVIVIGTTGVGKSKLGIQLAQHLSGFGFLSSQCSFSSVSLFGVGSPAIKCASSTFYFSARPYR